MNKLIPLLCMILLASGCGLFKSTTRTKNLEKSSVQVTYKKDSTDLTVDRSVVTINEKIDTVITTPRKTVSQSTATPLSTDSLYNGMTAMVNDLLTITLKLDSVTGILNTTVTLQPISIPVSFDKTTRIERDVTKSIVTGENIKYAEKKEASAEIKTKQPAKMGIWLIFGCIVIVGVTWWINKRLFKL